MTVEQLAPSIAPTVGPLVPKTSLQSLAQHTPVALLTLDQSCRILEANTAAEELAGTTLDGKRFCEAYRNQPRGESTCTSCPFMYALRGYERRSRPRWLTIDTGSAPKAVLFKATTSAFGTGVTLIPSTLVDDADLRRREMLAAAIHDLRHPITAQSLAIDLLETQLRGDPSLTDARMLLSKLQHATSFMAVSVDDLLNRMMFEQNNQVINPQTMAVLPAVEHLVWYMQPMLDRRKQTIRVDVPKGLWMYADQTALEHIVVNLVYNAHRYSYDQDRIVIAARARPALNATELSVRDHGPGVAKAERRRVFDRFYRGEQSARQRGAGLGLSIVRTLVERHGGTVGVRAARGGGALFWIRFPNPEVGASS